MANWQSLAGLLVLAASVSAGLIIVLRPLLARYALARPNARSSHRGLTPQGGGIAVVVAMLLAVLAFAALRLDAATISAWWPTAVAVVVLAIVGAVDDIRIIEIAPRLLLQFLAVGAVVILLPAEMRIVSPLPFWLERVLLMVGGVYFVNLVNFMDGIDWMTVAEVVPVTLGIALIALIDGRFALEAACAVALCGATLGFAPFNRPVAKLFLGDVGSLPIGLMLFWLLVRLAGNGHLVAALLLPLYYLADATITLLRRLVRGEKIYQAHRTHFYQRALDCGFSVSDVIRRVFIVNLGLLTFAAWTVWMPQLAVQIGALVAGAALVGTLLALLSKGRR